MKYIFFRHLHSESLIGGIKIAFIAGRNLKYSNCEQIGDFSDK